MARSIAGRLNQEADQKGLTGDKRQAWIGGAWNRIKGKEHRSAFRSSDEAKLLARYFGPIHDIRQRKRGLGIGALGARHRDHIVIRQGKQWYDLSHREYAELVLASKEEARREAQAAKDAATEKKAAARQAHMEAAFRAQQERDLRRMERQQYHEVVSIIRQGGGIKPSVTRMGTKHDRGEYRALPSTVRSSTGRLSADDAARNVNAEIPWLHLDTANALYDYFDRHRTRGYSLRKQSAA